jgi:hypothetical protein
VIARDADAAVRALSRHFGITREFVELAAPLIAEVNGAT